MVVWQGQIGLQKYIPEGNQMYKSMAELSELFLADHWHSFCWLASINTGCFLVGGRLAVAVGSLSKEVHPLW